MFWKPKGYFKNRKVKRPSREEIEPHEIFLDNLAQKKEKEIGITEKKLEVPLSQKVLGGFYIVFLLIIFLLFLKTFQLQIIEGEKFSLLSEENKTRIIRIPAERGVMYDSLGNLLVKNIPSFDFVCDRRDLPPRKEERLRVVKEISEIIQKDFSQLEKEIEESGPNEVLLLQKIPHEILILLEAKGERFPGCKVEKNTTREYVSSPLFSHLLGFTGKIGKEELKNFQDYFITDLVGKSGIEKSYEEFLRGSPGKIYLEKDVFGNVRSKKEVSDPQPGKSLVLYLNADLQKKLAEELALTLQRVGAKKGAAVAMDPNTGGILALVSLPSFDNNLFARGITGEELEKIIEDPLQPLFNRAIAGEYATGSTIKPFIASAALQEKIIDPKKTIYVTGKIEVPHEYNPEIIYTFLDWRPHGLVDMRRAIAVSSNVYFYTVGGGYGEIKGLGPDRIKKYLSLFGWGKSTGIDLPQEKTGFLPDPAWKKEVIGENWFVGNTYHFSIGQGYLRITPLQVVSAFSAIANGGKLLKPQIVQKIIDTSGGEQKILKEFSPEIVRENFIDPENLKVVREGMREGVTYGSSVILDTLPVKAAAKTGTAETGREGYFHNWVAVFAPYENPQIVLTIVIEDVPQIQAAALPVAKNVLEWYFAK